MLKTRFAAAIDELGNPLNHPFAVAVSGGGDSVALMHLIANWLKDRNTPTERGHVLIVDHGLREGSAKEALIVADWARRLGFAAHVLRSCARKPKSNIEDHARKERYALLGEWCRAEGISALMVAHSMDDQAETFLLRLGRGSGVDGLSAMRRHAPLPLPGYDGIEILRPLLDIRRSELRDYLTRRKISWLEDPMNQDPRFARTRIRAALPALEAAGVSTKRIAEATAHLARARDALDDETRAFLAEHVRFHSSGATVDGDALRRLPREIGLRALSAVLMQVAHKAYRPRFERLEGLYDSVLRSERARTLSGCRIGGAPKERRSFGPATLEIRLESPRKPAKAGAEREKPKGMRPLQAPAAARKLPKKGRIVASSLGFNGFLTGKTL